MLPTELMISPPVANPYGNKYALLDEHRWPLHLLWYVQSLVLFASSIVPSCTSKFSSLIGVHVHFTTQGVPTIERPGTTILEIANGLACSISWVGMVGIMVAILRYLLLVPSPSVGSRYTATAEDKHDVEY